MSNSRISLLPSKGAVILQASTTQFIVLSTGQLAPKGAKGDSAYQVWLDNGNEGDEDDFLNVLRGEDDWGFYKDHWSVKPTKVSDTTSRAVWAYTLDGTTRFRQITKPYAPTDDIFFSSFDGTALSGIVAKKG
jgi:hypothetical protein